MKNLTLGFLVFITTFLNAQSVDPETFPMVVGAISNKNVYTNTGGEGKISVQSIIDSAKINAIPLSGTEVGNPITGDIEIEDGLRIFPTIGGGGYYLGDNEIGGISIGVDGSITIVNNFVNYPSFKGLGGHTDYSANITDLDYTQKIYVDTKVAKIGADDIEITDFNKGIILTSPNSSRYRITVDNSGNLITTLIP